jgi:exopolyphosphatase/guanosine-5'-triphosphate,3'-diphosphate pyrophosphatase
MHGLTDREREWLEYAALMHDIGGHISFSGHHKHSYYLIKNGDLRGFHPDEIDVMALVARYHRRGTPKRSHPQYAQLPATLRRTVRTLASILRVAESLDRSHAQPVSGLAVHDRGEDVVIRLHSGGDAELEIWATARHLEPFEQVVGKPVRLEMAEAEPPTATATRSRGDRNQSRVNPDLTVPKRLRNSRSIGLRSYEQDLDALPRSRDNRGSRRGVRRRQHTAGYRK